MTQSNSSSTAPAVQHDETVGSFKHLTDGHLLSHLDYLVESVGGHTRMVCTHTYVPPALRGRGIAEQLVRTALGEARNRGWRVVPACSYVDTFIQRHAEYRDLLA